MQQAAKLLMHTNLSVKEIAGRTGSTYVTDFDRVLKAHCRDSVQYLRFVFGSDRETLHPANRLIADSRASWRS